jgi:NifU-like protein involved in Fe-S cluster formation
MDDLYSNDLLAEAGALPEARRLDTAMATARKVSRVCGSEISVDLSLEKGRVSEFAMRVKACALGQASAAIVSRHIKGERSEVLRRLRGAMWAMLKGEADLPDFSGWEDLQKLTPIKSYPARHVSTMLIFDAVVDCLDQIEGKQQKCDDDE